MGVPIRYSVIVPFYNAEETLRRCLDSLLCQIREDTEVILISDGSVDNSESIALDYVQKNPAFRLIRQENAGVSCARNAGLDAAKGRYITFVDSDDYVRADYFSVLDRNDDCDLLVFCHEIIGNDPRDMPALFDELAQKKTFSERFELLLSTRRIMSPWDKRFKKEIIDLNHIRFPKEMHIGEDFNFCMAYTVLCRDIGIETEQIICNDITGQDSLSRKYRPNLDKQMESVFIGVANTIMHCTVPSELKCKLLSLTDYLFVKHVFSCISENFKIGDISYFKNRNKIKAICRVFQRPLTKERYCIMHRVFRLLLIMNIYFPFYAASYMKKRHTFRGRDTNDG